MLNREAFELVLGGGGERGGEEGERGRGRKEGRGGWEGTCRVALCNNSTVVVTRTVLLWKKHYVTTHVWCHVGFISCKLRPSAPATTEATEVLPLQHSERVLTWSGRGLD